MKRTTATWVLASTLFVTVACSGANDGQAGATETAAATVPTHEPTDERLMERSRERASILCAGEWIEVYDFVHPETREFMSIYAFLEGKDNHAYADPTEPSLVAREGDTAYVSLTVLWTPKHPILADVDNVPQGHDFTERIEWIETWEFVDGDWHMRWPMQPPDEFFQQHPELLKKAEPAGVDEEVAQAGDR